MLSHTSLNIIISWGEVEVQMKRRMMKSTAVADTADQQSIAV